MTTLIAASKTAFTFWNIYRNNISHMNKKLTQMNFGFLVKILEMGLKHLLSFRAALYVIRGPDMFTQFFTLLWWEPQPFPLAAMSTQLQTRCRQKARKNLNGKNLCCGYRDQSRMIGQEVLIFTKIYKFSDIACRGSEKSVAGSQMTMMEEE